MADVTTESEKFDAEIPEYYDRLLGPFCFRPYAEELLHRLDGLKPGHLLEVAAGTGVVTEVLRTGLGPEWTITASDLNEEMLCLARVRPALASGVTFEIANAIELPFEDNSFDVVVCQFGWMFFPDKDL